MGNTVTKKVQEAQREAEKEAEKYPEAVRDKYRPIVTLVVRTKVVTNRPAMMEESLVVEEKKSLGLEPENTPTNKRENSAEQGTSSPKKQKTGIAAPEKETMTFFRLGPETKYPDQCNRHDKRKMEDQCIMNHIKNFAIFKEWPAYEKPERVIAAFHLDGILTLFVKKEIPYELENVSVLNTILVHSADFKLKFPQMVIEYYQRILRWN